MKLYYYSIAILLSILLTNCGQKTTKKEGEVYFIPTLHGWHKKNPKFDYDTLFSIIDKINPDILAVEIRAEDINEDSTYLKRLYPYEMRIAKERFPNAQIVGFDWLGDEFKGRTLTEDDLNTEFRIHALGKKLSQDSVYVNRLKRCSYRYNEERYNLVLNLGLPELLKSEDAEIVKEYYACLHEQLTGTPYQEYIEFFANRDEEIFKNIQSILKEHEGKTIVIITGDDHFQMLKDRFPNKQPI